MRSRVAIVHAPSVLALVLIACGCGMTGLATASSGRTVPGGDPSRGQQAIVHYGCGACHVIPGIAGANGKVGPYLTNLSDRQMIAGRLSNSPDNLEHWIQDPQGVSPGTAMPYMGVTDADARDIAAYLYSHH